MKKVKIGNAVLCEHVAQGANNKHILINTYSGDIIVQSFPANIPLGFYIEMEMPDAAPREIDVDLVYGGKTRVIAKATVSGMGGMGVLAIPLVPFTLERPGKFEVYISAYGVARTIAIRKNISQGNVARASNAPRRPSGRSRSVARLK
jgi:hypothetical protein